MKKFTTFVSAVALSAALAGSVSAQTLSTQGAPGSLPPAVQQLVASAGGVGVVTAVSILVVGTALVVKITKNDGTTTTTTVPG